MAIDQENTDTADESAGAPASSTRKGGTTFETLAVCGFIFGMFAIAAAVFAVGLAARAVTEAEGGGGGGEAAAGSGGPTVQEVTLGDFFIDRHEVTQREFKRFVDAGGYSRPEFWRAPFVDGARTLPFAEAMARFVDRTGLPGPATWEVSDYPEGRDDDPVTGVSWSPPSPT